MSATVASLGRTAVRIPSVASATDRAERRVGEDGLRHDWIVGLDVGAGGSRWDLELDTSEEEGRGLGGEIGLLLGRRVSPALSVGARLRVWGGGEVLGTWYQLVSIAASVDVFPFGRSGFFLGGGLGYGRFSLGEETSWTIMSEEASYRREESADGIVFAGSVGYAWRRGKRFELGPEATVEGSRFGERPFGGEAWMWSVGVRCRWGI